MKELPCEGVKYIVPYHYTIHSHDGTFPVTTTRQFPDDPSSASYNVTGADGYDFGVYSSAYIRDLLDGKYRPDGWWVPMVERWLRNRSGR